MLFMEMFKYSLMIKWEAHAFGCTSFIDISLRNRMSHTVGVNVRGGHPGGFCVILNASVLAAVCLKASQ